MVKKFFKLPLIITEINLKQIHRFYRSLNIKVHSLKTLEKPDTADILFLETLEKLGAIKAHRVCIDPNWQIWGFEKLLKLMIVRKQAYRCSLFCTMSS